MKKRHIFAGANSFFLYDCYSVKGGVSENIFAYSNSSNNGESALVIYNNFWEEDSGWIDESPVNIPQKDGTTRRDKLAQALLLHNDGAYFTLLREMRSGLWFIRSSKELYEKGLFISLHGYQSQVFVDVKEVSDGVNSYWASLNHSLNGCGVIDPDDALQDLVYSELYEPLHKLLITKDAEIIDDALSAAFIDALLKQAGVNNKIDVKKPAHEAAVELAHELTAKLKEHESYFARVYAILMTLRSLTNGGTKQTAPSLAKSFGLERKFREAAVEMGIEVSEAEHGAKAAICAIGIFSRALREKPAKNQADSNQLDISQADISQADAPAVTPVLRAINENYEKDDFRALLGINIFDGTVWFNKEKAELSLREAALFAAMEGIPDATISQTVKQYEKALAKSAYKFDAFLAGI
jgi:hypothetical protein